MKDIANEIQKIQQELEDLKNTINKKEAYAREIETPYFIHECVECKVIFVSRCHKKDGVRCPVCGGYLITQSRAAMLPPVKKIEDIF